MKESKATIGGKGEGSNSLQQIKGSTRYVVIEAPNEHCRK